MRSFGSVQTRSTKTPERFRRFASTCSEALGSHWAFLIALMFVSFLLQIGFRK